jgi:hypothetical protein
MKILTWTHSSPDEVKDRLEWKECGASLALYHRRRERQGRETVTQALFSTQTPKGLIDNYLVKPIEHTRITLGCWI